MAYVILGVAAVMAIGLVVGATIGAGVGGLLVALAFVIMVLMAIMSPSRPLGGRPAREQPSTWRGSGLPSRRDDDPIE